MSGGEKTLAALTVKIGANIEAFQSGLTKAEKRLAKMERNFKRTGQNLTKNLTAPLAGLATVSVAAFAKQDEAINKLRAQLQANGKNVETTLSKYQTFASSLQAVTTVGDETTLGLMQMAESMGALDTEKATKDAIGLSKALGVDLNTAIKMTTLAQNGEYTMLNRYVPAMRSATSETEKAAIANKLFADGFKIAEAEAKSGIGPIIQMKNAVGDLMETFGAVVAEAITPFVSKVQQMAEKLQEMDPEMRKTIVTIAGVAAAIGPVLLVASKLIGMVKGITSAMKVLNSVIMKNPWAVLAAVLIALVGYFIKLWKTSETFRAKMKYTAQSVSAFFQKAWILIKQGAEMMWLGIKTYFTAIPKAAAAIWKAVKRAMKGEKLGDVLAEEFGNIVNSVQENASEIKNKYSEQLAAIETPNYQDILSAEKAVEAATDAGEKTGEAFNSALAATSGGASLSGGRAKMPEMGTMETKSVSSVSGGGFGDAMELEVDKIEAQSERLYSVATQMKETLGKVFVDLGQMISSSLNDAFVTLGESIGSLAAGQSTMGDVFKSMLGVVLDFTSALGKALIAAGIGKMSFDKLLSVGGGPLAIAAGTALIGLSAAVKGIMSKGVSGGGSSSGGGGDTGDFATVPALASGGIATAPTLAMIGDSKNSMPNREAIVPLDKMNGMFGNLRVTGTLRASGRELLAVIESENKRVNTVK